jgi:hypothetical protein
MCGLAPAGPASARTQIAAKEAASRRDEKTIERRIAVTGRGETWN